MIDRSEFMSPFAKRGDQLKNGFTKRFGGGAFASADLVDVFKPDASQMMKDAVPTDTKMINDLISSAIDERLGEIPQNVEEPTYSKQDIQYDTSQMPQSFSNLEGIQEAMRKTFNSGAQDPTMQNAAAALSTTDAGTLAGLEGLNFNFSDGAWDFLQNIQQDNPLLQNLNTGADLYNPELVTDSEQEEPVLQQPEFDPFVQPILNSLINQDNVQPPLEEETRFDLDTGQPPVKEERKTPSYINDKFNETLDNIYDEIEEIKGIGKTQDDTLDDIYDEIEGITVIGKTQDENIDDLSEEIESIDVEGLTDEEDIEDILVSGRREDDSYCRKVSKDVKEIKEQTMEEKESDNPWERFKRLYADFYGGDSAGEILKEVKAREDAYDASLEESSTADLDESSMNPMTSDTAQILNAKKEKDDLDAFSEMLDDYKNSTEEKKSSAPIVINSNRTITAKAADSKTERVFSNENTFNRLAGADSNHPQYMGYGR